ncbi:macrolide ABC transporter permease/ATP-binding protein MacB [Trinickia dabaoshanensis]|uniref:Macrolide ABC transporter permease/ATP-binding protein MacB n=1 Tax=Trinickia dabaoshanensis TaxID=564714 RepID=A0A2N7VGP4_9BURK|nr:MacB family efflux pump subunit [Trinickia dabaoshanensis]PMS16316.1 macrolide ABC transporter permease/ATP-binding protein MacB [Trinickia dabaoshanensis]
MAEPLLALRGVARRYLSGDKEIEVLRDIDLDIAAGEFVAIMGASGSGKSTLMNVLGCLDRPSAGLYRVGGVDVGELEPDALAQLRRERFGFVFQRYHLMPHLTAADNVQVPSVYAGATRSERISRSQALLAQLGLADRAGHRPNQLSGGQQQRVSIARALMNDADVILADEPTGALDSQSGSEVMRLLCELHAAGRTVVLVTHDEQVAAYAQRVVEMRDGAIVGDRRRAGATIAFVAPGKAPATPTAAMRPVTAARSMPLRFIGARVGQALATAWAALLAHRLRTLLTMLGIVIGIMAVVSIVAVGEGAKRYMLDEIGAMGTNTIDVYPGRDWGDSDASQIKTLVAADADALAHEPYVDSVTPGVNRTAVIRHGNVDVQATVTGVGEHYFQVRGLRLAQGIAFDSEAVRRTAQVAVIDANARRKLFGAHADVIGETILVGNVPCVVIGVAAEKRAMWGGGMNELTVWVPHTTASARLVGGRRLDGIIVRIKAGQPSEAAERGVVELLTRRHGRKDFFTYNMDTVVKTVQSTGRALTLLLSLIAIVSLVVGGIGVMNIMLVSVTERTREIGIRMAVGARRSDVMLQFLVEAVLVCLMGGTIGIALSFGAGFVFSAFVDQWSMIFSTNSLIFAVACSTAIGVAFGFIPARNAARLDPVQALARD